MAQTILIVEDDPATREGLSRWLGDAGYDTVAVSDVPAALRALVERQPDLLITDIRLDAHNGLHVIAMAPRPVPAIVLTGFADPSLEADARRLGADYLVKPVLPSVLRQVVARKLASAERSGVFMQTRQAPRRRVMAPVSVLVGQQPARLLDVSEIGVRLEVRCIVGAGLSVSLTLYFVESGVSVPVEVAWKRRVDETTWICGGTIGGAARPVWRELLETF